MNRKQATNLFRLLAGMIGFALAFFLGLTTPIVHLLTPAAALLLMLGGVGVAEEFLTEKNLLKNFHTQFVLGAFLAAASLSLVAEMLTLAIVFAYVGVFAYVAIEAIKFGSYTFQTDSVMQIDSERDWKPSLPLFLAHWLGLGTFAFGALFAMAGWITIPVAIIFASFGVICYLVYYTNPENPPRLSGAI